MIYLLARSRIFKDPPNSYLSTYTDALNTDVRLSVKINELELLQHIFILENVKFSEASTDKQDVFLKKC